MIDLLLGTAIATVAMPQNVEAMSVRPMSEIEAVNEFENACVRGLNDATIVSAAAARSARGYTEAAAVSGAGGRIRNWSSRYGTLQYVDRSGIQGGRSFRECSFTAFTPDRVNRKALDAELEAMAGRRAENRITAVDAGKASGWIWRDAEMRRVALYSIADPRTPHQITLSIQSEDSGE